MNATSFMTNDYENETLGERGKNEPKTNPIKPNFKTGAYAALRRLAIEGGETHAMWWVEYSLNAIVVAARGGGVPI